MSLTSTVRRLTGASRSDYTIDGTAYWSDEQIQDVIDSRVCARLIQAPIGLIPSIDAQGRTVFVHGRVLFPGTLDVASATAVDTSGIEIADATIYDDGRVDFDTDQASSTPLLSGLAFDLYGAGADLLTSWASAVKGGVDIAEDGQSFRRSQGHRQMLDQAAVLRSRAVAGTVHIGRSDVRPARHRSPRTRAVLKAWERINR